MTAFWDDWATILELAGEGNELAFDAIEELIQRLHDLDHARDKQLARILNQGYLKDKMLLVLCRHRFYPLEGFKAMCQCVVCGWTLRDSVVADWLRRGWIRGQLESSEK